jgi:hypothetical protein
MADDIRGGNIEPNNRSYGGGMVSDRLVVGNSARGRRSGNSNNKSGLSRSQIVSHSGGRRIIGYELVRVPVLSRPSRSRPLPPVWNSSSYNRPLHSTRLGQGVRSFILDFHWLIHISGSFSSATRLKRRSASV